MAVTTWPRIDWRTRRSSPAPWHSGQRTAVVPARAPVPSQVAQPTRASTVTRAGPRTPPRGSRARAPSRRRRPAPGPPGAAAPPAAPPKKASKRSPEAARRRCRPAPGPGVDAVGAEAVVAGPALGVAQHLVGARHLLEARLGLGVAAGGVGVQLAGHAAVGALDLVVGGVGATPRAARSSQRPRSAPVARSLGRRVRRRASTVGPGRGGPSTCRAEVLAQLLGRRAPPRPGPVGSACGWARPRRWCRPPRRRWRPGPPPARTTPGARSRARRRWPPTGPGRGCPRSARPPRAAARGSRAPTAPSPRRRRPTPCGTSRPRRRGRARRPRQLAEGVDAAADHGVRAARVTRLGHRTRVGQGAAPHATSVMWAAASARTVVVGVGGEVDGALLDGPVGQDHHQQGQARREPDELHRADGGRLVAWARPPRRRSGSGRPAARSCGPAGPRPRRGRGRRTCAPPGAGAGRACPGRARWSTKKR